MLRKSESGPMAWPRRMAFSAAGKLLYQRASERRVSAGTRYLIAVCCVSFATNVAAERSTLSGDAIKAAVTGAVLEIDTPLGVKVPGCPQDAQGCEAGGHAAKAGAGCSGDGGVRRTRRVDPVAANMFSLLPWTNAGTLLQR